MIRKANNHACKHTYLCRQACSLPPSLEPPAFFFELEAMRPQNAVRHCVNLIPFTAKLVRSCKRFARLRVFPTRMAD